MRNLLKKLFSLRLDKSEPRRLAIARLPDGSLNEKSLREKFYKEHYEKVKNAREYIFENTPQIWETPRKNKT